MGIVLDGAARRLMWTSATVVLAAFALMCGGGAAFGVDDAVAVRFVAWTVVPAQLASLAACVLLALRLPPGLRRRGWTWLAITLLLNVSSTSAWLVAESLGAARTPETHSTDVLVYLVPGPVALYWFTRAIVGPLRVGLLLDSLSLTFAIGAVLWLAFVAPELPAGPSAEATLTLVAHSVPMVVPTVAAGLLYTHVNDWRRERSMLLLLLGVFMNLTGDLLWLDRAQPDRLGDALLYGACYIAANGALVAACVVEARRTPNEAGAPISDGYSLLPVLIALGILSVLVARGDSVDGVARAGAVGLIAAALLALLAREWVWRREQARTAMRERAVNAMIAEEFDQRSTISRGMHEGVAQDLSAVAFSLAAAQRSPATLEAAVPAVLERLRESVKRTRELASAIAPLEVARGSLSTALRAYLDVRERVGAGECELRDELDATPVAEPVGEALYALVVDAAAWLTSNPRLCLERIVLRPEAARDVVLELHAHGPAEALGELDVTALGDRVRALGGTVHLALEGDRRVRIEARVASALPAGRP